MNRVVCFSVLVFLLIGAGKAVPAELRVSFGTTFHAITSDIDPNVVRSFGWPRFSSVNKETRYIPPGTLINVFARDVDRDAGRIPIHTGDGELGYMKANDNRIRGGNTLLKQFYTAYENDLNLFVVVKTYQMEGDIWISPTEGPYLGSEQEDGSVRLSICREFNESKYENVQAVISAELPQSGFTNIYLETFSGVPCISSDVDAESIVAIDDSNLIVKRNYSNLIAFFDHDEEFVYHPKFPVVYTSNDMRVLKTCGDTLKVSLTREQIDTLSASISATVRLVEIGLNLERTIKRILSQEITFDATEEGSLTRYLRVDTKPSELIRRLSVRYETCRNLTESHEDLIYSIPSVDRPIRVGKFFETFETEIGKPDAEKRIHFQTTSEFLDIREKLFSWLRNAGYIIDNSLDRQWLLNQTTYIDYNSRTFK